MDTNELPELPDVPWVVLDWGVMRSIGAKLEPPTSLVTVMPDVLARESATASDDYPGIEVANAILAKVRPPHPIAVAHEWHHFDVDAARPPQPVAPTDVANTELTKRIRGNIACGRPAFSTDRSDLPGDAVKRDWAGFVELFRPIVDEHADELRDATHNILKEPQNLIGFYIQSMQLNGAMSDETVEQWTEAILSNPSGFPKFLFAAAILFYATELASKGVCNEKALENDFDDLHYLVLAGVIGHICTAENPARGNKTAHLPDALKHIYGEGVQLWSPEQWRSGKRTAQE